MSSQSLAVVGHPIAHSKSPALHHAAYSVLGLDWSYEAIDVEPDAFPAFLAGPGAQLRGISVTMPHKTAALEASTSLDLLAERTLSVNTLFLASPDQILGFNTDVAGIVHAFQDAGVTHARHVVIVGGGATASSAVAAAAEMGAEHISVLARTPAKAFFLEQVGQDCGVNVTVHLLEDMSSLTPADVVISTLPGTVAFSLDQLPRTARATLLDVAYSPWPSSRSAAWNVAGGEAVSGLRMLAHQALIQVRIFVTGSPVDVLPREEVIKNAMFASVGLSSL
ncbi:shikimate dehydrogenase [Aurantimicrobium minutum]|uniref:shikimate dehydrogenase family protein n=1 Tax=Aurantimicrobium minutum TaxID=708131 RepID=UPI002473A772|nr:shikimate dehydrogenase [Aurantimicrobium minutum]MDH6532999.1 shikimate dehydrogenase [Aurantimicrobium minutum]